MKTGRPPLPIPPFYFPLRHGRYDVAPGLNRFGKDLGGGEADQDLFQIDRTFDQFRAAKTASRAENLNRYICTSELTEEVAAAVTRLIVDRLASERPTVFSKQPADRGQRLHSKLTGETLTFDDRMRLLDVSGSRASPAHVSALDAVACQVQEDLAIVSTAPGRHWVSALHICLPNGWAPEEKIGGTFASIHEPVAGMGEMNRRGDEFADLMTHATDGFVRFAWGVTFDDRLNHHPRIPRTRFDPAHPAAFLRVERQTIWGLANVGAALFTIRTYLYNCDNLRQDPATRKPLVSALRTMPQQSLGYKGLSEGLSGLLSWLGSGAA